MGWMQKIQLKPEMHKGVAINETKIKWIFLIIYF